MPNETPSRTAAPGAPLPVEDAARGLLAYCRNHKWAGYDPYDGLNSRVFNSLPFLHRRFPRLCLIQFMKRSPVNLRPLLLVGREQNAKGTALFATALMRLSQAGFADVESDIDDLLRSLMALRSPGRPFACWGYNFDWQNRGGLVPRGMPNIICTTAAGNALLDAYETRAREDCLDVASSAGEFILHDLYSENGTSGAHFNYTPIGETSVHNANLLGAAYVCRLHALTGDARLREPVFRAARYSVSKQYDDGSWDYGERDSPSQRWKDNFHTGFNLGALAVIAKYGNTTEFNDSIERGYGYYLRNFFTEDGAPKYYHDRTYPIDAHCVAQSLITLCEFKDLDPAGPAVARSVYAWAVEHMRSRKGFFYYQKHPAYTNRIPYMRWTQAWMLCGLASLLIHDGARRRDPPEQGRTVQ